MFHQEILWNIEIIFWEKNSNTGIIFAVNLKNFKLNQFKKKYEIGLTQVTSWPFAWPYFHSPSVWKSVIKMCISFVMRRHLAVSIFFGWLYCFFIFMHFWCYFSRVLPALMRHPKNTNASKGFNDCCWKKRLFIANITDYLLPLI